MGQGEYIFIVHTTPYVETKFPSLIYCYYCSLVQLARS